METISSFKNNIIADFSAKKYAFLQYESDDKIKEVQTTLFLNHLHYTLGHSPFYKKLFSENQIDLNDINTMSDIGKLPLTKKQDLSDTDPFLSVDDSKIVDICLTSATSGSSPTVISLTNSDLSRLAYNEELAFEMAGITNLDTMLICAALDRCFMAGLAYFLGGTKLGAKILRSGAGSPSQHWELINLTHATAIVGVPSLMYKIGQYAMENNQDPAATGIKRLIAIGEPTKDANLKLLPIATQLEEMWGAKIYSTYASSEIATTFCECSARSGGHLRPELNIIEILDDNDQPCKDGEKGEVVITPLGVEAMPLIRFKTGDISYLITQECACGRTTKRLAPIIGRKNQMLKYKGTTVFPNAILSSLEGDLRFHGGYIEVKKNDDGTDRIILYAALSKEAQSIDWIKDVLRAKVRVVPEIEWVTREAADKKIYQFDKKRKRLTFFDLRDIK